MTTFEIAKQFTFSAAHRLAGLDPGHPCSRIHGHNYVAEVRLSAPNLASPGFVLDYGDLTPFGTWLNDTFDHRWLGSGVLLDGDAKILPVVGFNPTAEILADHFRDWLLDPGNLLASVAARMEEAIGVIEVGVSETPKTWAWAR